MYLILAGVVGALWLTGLARVRVLRGRAVAARDEGASALEWAVISAILVTAAVLIGGVVYTAVQKKSDAIKTCANQGANATQC